MLLLILLGSTLCHDGSRDPVHILDTLCHVHFGLRQHLELVQHLNDFHCQESGGGEGCPCEHQLLMASGYLDFGHPSVWSGPDMMDPLFYSLANQP